MATMIENLLTWLRQHWPYFLASALALMIGIAIGWALKPDTVRVEERLKVVEVEKQVVALAEKVRVEVVRVKDTQIVERWRRQTQEETRVDGSKLRTETEERNIDSVVKIQENQTEIKVVEVEKQVVVTRDVDRERIVSAPAADWHLGVLVGAQPQFLPTLGASLAIGGYAERRLLGPVFAGVWGLGTTNGQGQAGVSLAVEIP